MKKPPPITEDERALFRDAMKNLRTPKATKTRSAPIILDETPHIDFHVTGKECLSFHRIGVRDKEKRQLKQGKLIIQGTLDLHGMEVREAYGAFQRFMHFHYEAESHCIRIIHGKGLNSREDYPRLKNGVNTWLRSLPFVMAFSSAPQKMGGAGATHVLLKRD